jgi:hypothetical protein
MKFLLDEDTSAKICSRLRQEGHRAETAQRAGYQGKKDEYVGDFADKIGGVLLSHDVTYHEDRKKTVMHGRHVLLRGSKPRSPDWFMANLPALLAKIEGCGVGFYEMREDDHVISFMHGRNG